MNATTWPHVRKTHAMRQIEADHGGKDIRDILLEALLNHATDKLAADTLRIDNTTLSLWLVRLRIDAQAGSIRNERSEVA